MFDTIHEDCGVFGAYRLEDAASVTYYGLHSLQHRGQEASGIAVYNGHSIEVLKGKGLTVDVFAKDRLDRMKGQFAIGHVRYSTAGGQEYENIQPIVANGALGPIAVAHNGQIVNDVELREELEAQGCIFQGTSDTEVILHLIMKEKGSLIERVKKTAARLTGAYCILVMQEDHLIAFRDAHGIHPLSYARVKDGYAVASETCAFEIMGIYESTDIKPGEIVEFTRGLVKHHFFDPAPSQRVCAMEYIYFARPDSVIDGLNVHAFRRKSGELLAQKDGDLKADMVIGVPDSSLSAAIGYAEKSGLPLETGLIKNRFVTRTFIQPTQAMRDQGVRMKLSAVRDVVEGKDVVMIDDSIVRGTTSRRIVALLKEAGARSVHVRIASPRLISPCFYGVDMATRSELIASSKSNDEIRDYIQADTLRYMSLEEIQQAARDTGLCMACFDMDYCTPLFSHKAALDAS